MASAVIHMAVANELNKTLKRDKSKLLIGSIAPDISKCIGESRKASHFLDFGNDIPNIERFIGKYKSKLHDDFVMGYFIHLYTDYLWFKYFMPEVYNEESCMITTIDNRIIKGNEEMIKEYIYNDYTNINQTLIDEYNMDLSIFYNEPPEFDDIIEEIPMDRLQVIIDKTSIIIENSKIHKDLIFNIDNIKKFVETSVNLTLAKIQELNL